jgi:glutamine---fructose-6-phosphate transaminase (isomerizing)
VLALANITNRIVFLESGDLVQIKKDSCIVFDHDGHEVSRPAKDVAMSELAVEKDGYNHFMLKEIFEQPRALKNTYKYASKSTNEYFGPGADDVFKRVKSVLIIACGTSYHAGAVARYELEKCGIMAQVEVASEYLYRQVVVPENCLIVFLSQSGETADTIAALNKSKKLDYLACLSICNVENSSLNVQTDFACLTHAGREIGVAATKTFTAQLVALQALCCALSRRSLFSLDELEQATQFVLQLDDAMHIWAQDFVDKRHALYLGRGSLFPIAQEGALKLKEISYLHAEAYPAGELKHGPLALIDQEMPVIALAPDDELLAKMLSNLAEVSARGGQLYILTSTDLQIDSKQVKVFNLPECSEMLRAIVYTVPLQLLSYHVAVLKGADVDQPRNLAKSVTVE